MYVTTNPRQPLLYCVVVSLLRASYKQVHDFWFWPGLGCGCRLQAVVWSSTLRSQPSARRQPSLTMHVLVLDCAHLLCVRACTGPPYLH